MALLLLLLTACGGGGGERIGGGEVVTPPVNPDQGGDPPYSAGPAMGFSAVFADSDEQGASSAPRRGMTRAAGDPQPGDGEFTTEDLQASGFGVYCWYTGSASYSTGDIKGIKWYDSALAPAASEGGALYIWGTSVADDSDLFDMLLWPLDAEWDRSAVGDLISDEDYDEFHAVATETAGMTLEERMETVQNILNEDGEVIHLFTDEFPKAG